jgi:DNA-binding transcriptional ArsR family regulator
MSKTCSVCSLPEEARQKIDDLLRQGVSRKKIAESVGKDFLTPITESSLNRHLKNCLATKNQNKSASYLPLIHAKMKNRTLKGIQLHKTLCNVLSEEIEKFIEHLDERTNNNRLDDFRCLDVLISMVQKLYPDLKNGVREDAFEPVLYMDSEDITWFLKRKIESIDEAIKNMTPEERADFERGKSDYSEGEIEGQKKIVFEEFRAWLKGEEGDFNERGIRVEDMGFKKFKRL